MSRFLYDRVALGSAEIVKYKAHENAIQSLCLGNIKMCKRILTQNRLSDAESTTSVERNRGEFSELLLTGVSI